MMAQSFRDVIELFGTPDALAGELGAKAETVRKWRQRNSIPAEWWLPVIEAGARAGKDLSAEQFASIASRPPTASPASPDTSPETVA